jgi:hypothetical protein
MHVTAGGLARQCTCNPPDARPQHPKAGLLSGHITTTVMCNTINTDCTGPALKICIFTPSTLKIDLKALCLTYPGTSITEVGPATTLMLWLACKSPYRHHQVTVTPTHCLQAGEERPLLPWPAPLSEHAQNIYHYSPLLASHVHSALLPAAILVCGNPATTGASVPNPHLILLGHSQTGSSSAATLAKCHTLSSSTATLPSRCCTVSRPLHLSASPS